MISIIAAIGKNRELGKNNKLLWHIKADMERFKKLTRNQIVIMGRKTYESLPAKFRPLPHRVNIVVTRNPKNVAFNNHPSLIIVGSIDEALKKAKTFNKEIFIAGGASIYKQTLEIADKLYLTIVEKNYPDADAFFPPYKTHFPKIISQTEGEENGLKYRFLELGK